MIMKQNNSIKQLLSKLRKHDTVVVAISVLIALVLCGGLIYLSTPVVASTTAREYEESNRESSQQTKEKLSEIKDISPSWISLYARTRKALIPSMLQPAR